MNDFNPNNPNTRKDLDELNVEPRQTEESSVHIPDYSRDEETAGEISPVQYETTDDEDDRVGTRLNSVSGWIGIALAVMSFFMLPVILGVAGIIVGFIARSRDAEWLGNTAISVGVISLIVRLFIVPFF
ncbi:MAG TPA: hypothetical protein VK044_00455 [Virgibacillus sp.]|nr:hypothetical protein [Virgibacillus sp.]